MNIRTTAVSIRNEKESSRVHCLVHFTVHEDDKCLIDHNYFAAVTNKTSNYYYYYYYYYYTVLGTVEDADKSFKGFQALFLDLLLTRKPSQPTLVCT